MYLIPFTHMLLDILPRKLIDDILQHTNADVRRMWALMRYRRRKARHDDECYNRVLWCLAQGPAFHPAHEHKHQAPGDDSRFFYGVPPWNADGSVKCVAAPPCPALLFPISDKSNEEGGSIQFKKFCYQNPNPGLAFARFVENKSGALGRPGVPPNFGEKEPLGKNQALMDDWDAGWNCTRCEQWVPQAPRKFEGGKEPVGWWWCRECRNSSVKALTFAQKQQPKAAASCRRLESYM